MKDVGVPASVTVNCVGVRSFKGTGPWVFAGSTVRGDGSISELSFTRNLNWWGEHGGVEQLLVVNYNTSDAVRQALLDGSLDVVVGDKVLTPRQVQEFETQHSGTFTTVLGPRLYNQIIVMNAAKAPTDNIEVRRLVMHSVNKAAIVEKEMYGQAAVADALFPRDAPYCDIDLTPRWDYDFEKAKLMNCMPKEESTDHLPLILGLTLGIGLPLLACIGVACFCFGKKKGHERLLDEDMQKRKEQRTAADVVGTPDNAA
mmetsp:Transcript_66373/g.192308  ORF Transcript_66373/g.192308 Transcript_66373/m.192308 type:complete len:258 (+) Transcript_66373:581-1354(+)